MRINWQSRETTLFEFRTGKPCSYSSWLGEYDIPENCHKLRIIISCPVIASTVLGKKTQSETQRWANIRIANYAWATSAIVQHQGNLINFYNILQG